MRASPVDRIPTAARWSLGLLGVLFFLILTSPLWTGKAGGPRSRLSRHL